MRPFIRRQSTTEDSTFETTNTPVGAIFDQEDDISNEVDSDIFSTIQTIEEETGFGAKTSEGDDIFVKKFDNENIFVPTVPPFISSPFTTPITTERTAGPSRRPFSRRSTTESALLRPAVTTPKEVAEQINIIDDFTSERDENILDIGDGFVSTANGITTPHWESGKIGGGIQVTTPSSGGIRVSPSGGDGGFSPTAGGGGIRVTTPGALGFSPVGGVFGASPQPGGFSLVGGSPTPPTAVGGRPRFRVTTESNNGIRQDIFFLILISLSKNRDERRSGK